MSNENLLDILNYNVGDEIWWFKISVDHYSQMYHFSLNPGQIELVHDTIKEIKEGMLHCWHHSKYPSEVWGKSRKEAWETLKKAIEKWGPVE